LFTIFRSTYVPFRNAHLLSVAVSWAEVLGASKIYIGAVEQDSSGYPDCRPAYYDAFNQVIKLGTKDGQIEIVTPLIQLRKSEIVRLGLELGRALGFNVVVLQAGKIAPAEFAIVVCSACGPSRTQVAPTLLRTRRWRKKFKVCGVSESLRQRNQFCEPGGQENEATFCLW